MQVRHRGRREAQPDVRPGAVFEREDHHVIVGRRRGGGRAAHGSTGAARTSSASSASGPSGASRTAGATVLRAGGASLSMIAAGIAAEVMGVLGLLRECILADVARITRASAAERT